MRRLSSVLVATVVVLLTAVTTTAGAQVDEGHRSADHGELTATLTPASFSETGKVETTLNLEYASPSFRPWRMNKITVTWPAHENSGCSSPETITKNPGRTEGRTISIPISTTLACNGSYKATVKATVGPPWSGSPNDDPGSESRVVKTDVTLTVTAPAPNVPGPLNADVEGGKVVLAWKLADKPADVSFQVERKSGDGSWKPVGTTNETLFGDEPGSGSYSYRVRTKRPSGGDNALSSDSDAPVATVDVPSTNGQAGGTGAGSSKPAGGLGKTPSTGSKATLPKVPSTGAKPSGAPTTTTASGGPMPTIDDGFDPVIDYGNDNPTLGGDDDYEAFGGATVLNDDGDGFTPRGLMKPAAGALVLAGWAVHIRRLARLAALPA